MKVLLDSCIGTGCLQAIREAGIDADRVGEDAPDPGDEAVLARGLEEGRILVTADKDFGELVFHRGHPHPGIVRLTAMAISRHAPVLLLVLRHYERELREGALLVVGEDRVRVRKPPRRPGPPKPKGAR